MKKPKKYLALCDHGLTVIYDLPPNTSGMPQTLCRHPWRQKYTFNRLAQVIKWVETIKQPKWGKTFRIWRFQISLSKYRD